MSFSSRSFGRTELTVSPLALATGGGSLPAKEVERAYDRGIRTFYWGSLRSGPFGAGLSEVARSHRDDIVVIVQSYTRIASLMRGSLERALKKLAIDHTDLLLLGWWNQPPPPAILDAAVALKERGLASHLMISCHNRLTFARYAEDPRYGAIMVRYNAAHPGAESEVFPSLGAPRPGVACYTATRWGHLLDPALVPSDEPRPQASDCYRFALTHPAVDLVMCAPRQASDLDEALETIERGPMSEDELARMKRIGAHVKKVTAGRRTFSPVEAIDRLGGWLSSRRSTGLDTASD